MTKKDVKIGSVYMAKVSKQLVLVKIVSSCLSGGWIAMNLTTRRHIKIRGVQRLRGEMKCDL